MSGRLRKLGQAHAARLERLIRKRREAAAPQADAARLTFAQKTAGKRPLSRTSVASERSFLTTQENIHARLL
jgi:hypothetical protein